jgi:general stress protein YciG
MAKSTAKRGFAAMDPAKQREIASKGGKASHGGGRPPSRSRQTANALYPGRPTGLVPYRRFGCATP